MSDVDEVKARIDILELIQGYVRLKKAGRNWLGLCPFHTEKTPSFSVSPELQIYKCFGCGRGGDSISFIQEIEGFTFREALQLLADRAGVKLKPVSGRATEVERDTKTILFRTLELATQLFHTLLTKHPSGKDALKYLSGRGVTDKTIATFRLGWVPQKIDITAILKTKGIHEAAIRQAGGLDRFKGRIVFPLFDQLGAVVGFTGRILGEGQPKYLNSMDSPIFHKSRTLYGLHLGKAAIRDKGYAVLLEGQMDVILCHQSGTAEAVATSGTAVSTDHLRILQRLCPEVRLGFDTDEAGQRALRSAAELALGMGIAVKTVLIPSGKDAADAIMADPTAWQNAVSKAPLFLDQLFDETFSKYEGVLGVTQKRAISRELIPWLRRASDPVERGHYTQMLSSRLGVSSKIIEEALGKPAEQTTADEPAVSKTGLEQQFIGLLAAHPELIERAVTQIDWQLLDEPLPQAVFKALQKGYTHKENNLKAVLTADLSDKDAAEVLSWGMQHNLASDDPQEELRGYLTRIKSTHSEQLKQRFAQEIEAAERKGDRQAVKALVEKLVHELKG